jgi:hypothetical protein
MCKSENYIISFVKFFNTSSKFIQYIKDIKYFNEYNNEVVFSDLHILNLEIFENYIELQIRGVGDPPDDFVDWILESFAEKDINNQVCLNYYYNDFREIGTIFYKNGRKFDSISLKNDFIEEEIYAIYMTDDENINTNLFNLNILDYTKNTFERWNTEFL